MSETTPTDAVLAAADAIVDDFGHHRTAAYFAGFARRVRESAGSVALMLAGGIRTREAMEALLADGGTGAELPA